MKKLTRREEKAFARYLFRQNFIAEGTGRKVYAWGDRLVIKVAKNRSGISQNKYEVIRFKKYGDDKLARIIAYSKKIVIMERVLVMKTYEINSLATWLDEITGVCSQDHALQGYRRGTKKLIAYDYGDTKRTYTKQVREDYFHREIVLKELN